MRAEAEPIFAADVDRDVRCPGCRALGLRIFYSAKEPVPTSSCVLVDSAEDAASFRRKPLSLAFCASCGLICNPLFDPTTQAALEGYEETQGFSSTFNAFARSLAQRLIDTHGLRGKTVLEIGCGKGEFISLMVELGIGRGIGVDPLLNPARSRRTDRLKFLGEAFRERHAELKPDFIVCRHTLEHIDDIAGFLALLRRVVEWSGASGAFFEVPDTTRILSEGAFWDIYYEHCSYFTAGSLARLFRAAGLGVSSVELAYGGQYLLLTADDDGSDSAFSESVQQTAKAVDRFAREVAASIEHWRSEINRRDGVVLWGSGSKAVGFLTALGDAANGIDRVVDINPHKHGKFMPGGPPARRIVSPDSLAERPPRTVVVMNPVYREEIEADLRRRGLNCEMLSLACR